MALLRRTWVGGVAEHYEVLIDAALQANSGRTRNMALVGTLLIRGYRNMIAQGVYRLARMRWTGNPKAPVLLQSPVPDAASEVSASNNNREKFGKLADTFLALHYSTFVLYAIGQIRNLALFLSIGFVLLVFSMSSYSFQAPQFIGRFLLALFALIAWVVWACLSGMERDPIVSRINGSDPGKLNADFYKKLIPVGALPVIGILASQFPAISNFLLSAVEPALESLK
jgi:hypothetical protein